MKKIYLLYCYCKDKRDDNNRLIFANEVFLNKKDADRYCKCMNEISESCKFIVIRQNLITDKEYTDEKIEMQMKFKNSMLNYKYGIHNNNDSTHVR